MQQVLVGLMHLAHVVVHYLQRFITQPARQRVTRRQVVVNYGRLETEGRLSRSDVRRSMANIRRRICLTCIAKFRLVRAAVRMTAIRTCTYHSAWVVRFDDRDPSLSTSWHGRAGHHGWRGAAVTALASTVAAAVLIGPAVSTIHAAATSARTTVTHPTIAHVCSSIAVHTIDICLRRSISGHLLYKV